MEMKAQRKPGLNVPNVSGQVGAGGTEADAYQATTLERSVEFELVRMHPRK